MPTVSTSTMKPSNGEAPPPSRRRRKSPPAQTPAPEPEVQEAAPPVSNTDAPSLPEAPAEPPKRRKTSRGTKKAAKPMEPTSDADYAALGRIYWHARETGVTPEEYIAKLRGIVETWDRLGGG